MNKLLGALGLCRKAGKLVMGFDAAAESAARKSLSTVTVVNIRRSLPLSSRSRETSSVDESMKPKSMTSWKYTMNAVATPSSP